MHDQDQSNHHENLKLSIVVPDSVGFDQPRAVSPGKLHLNSFGTATVSTHELLHVRVKLAIWRIDLVDGWVGKRSEVCTGNLTKQDCILHNTTRNSQANSNCVTPVLGFRSHIEHL